MPLARFNNLPQDKRAELLRISTEELVARGADGASLNDILSRAGLSKGSFYYYFEDKEDLIATVLEAMLGEYLKAAWVDAVEPTDATGFWTSVEQNLARSVDLVLASPALIRILTSLPASMREHPRLAPLKEKENAVLRRQIAVGQRLGEVRTDLPVERLLGLWDALDAALDSTLVGREESPRRAELEAHMHLVLDSFRRLMAVGIPRAGGAPKARKLNARSKP